MSPRSDAVALNATNDVQLALQHHVYLHLISGSVVKELHWLLGPGELASDIADREVLQQWPDESALVRPRT